MIPVSEKDMDVVQKEQKVKFKVRSYPGKTFEGKVTKVPQQGELKENRPVFWITARADNQEFLLKPGMTGQAKIYCGKKPILSVILRKIVRWFRIEVWSWF
jgi:multidrug efflux pump subunit AcrA (membrane-fusion protein)